MLRFTARRLLAALPIVLGVASLVFLLAQLAPGRAFSELEGPGVTPGAAEHLRTLFGADRPLWERYALWLRDSMTGNLGVSQSLRAPVSTLLAEGLRNSFLLAMLALLLQFVLGIAGGLASCWFKGGWLDSIVVTWASVLYALPSFCVGMVLVGVFAVKLGWFPVSQMHAIDSGALSPWGRLVDLARHLILPVLTLSLPGAGGVALYVREKVRSLAGSPFLIAARSRGAGRSRTMLHHALRNALLPVVTLVGLSLPGFAGGAVVIEVLYAWPGMGRLAYQAVLARDEPLILGCTLVTSLAVVLGGLAADLAAAAVDPRVQDATT